MTNRVNEYLLWFPLLQTAPFFPITKLIRLVQNKASMVGISKMRGCPPLASSETLYSSSVGHFDTSKEKKMKMMTWEQFKR